MSTNYITQNELLLSKLVKWYSVTNNLNNMLNIINGKSKISLRIVDWFTTNYSKKHFINYSITNNNITRRFNVYNDYKLKLKAYSKRRFDPFCRWDRVTIPYENVEILTTIGQLNFFKWALQNNVINYIHNHYSEIEKDMNARNSTSKRGVNDKNQLTRKKREELSVSATKQIIKEEVEITLQFN